ncbi:MAG: Holliday junction branch migration protein RuvA [Brevinematales bacterium]|nr:Holliday junction branch migration protein RuvA [Brevinematales bacterium]
MFNFLSGKIVSKEENLLVLECNGVGYEILIPTRVFNSLPEIGSELKIYVKFILRENEAYFVGFRSQDEKKVFDLLLTVNGLGIKQSLRILSELSVDDIRKAIVMENERIFSSVKGIGSKLASRIVLELSDKIKKLELSDKIETVNEFDRKKLEVLMALKVLGYSEFEAKKAIDNLFSDKEFVNNTNVENIIKKILSTMIR